MSTDDLAFRKCLREPIPEIEEAANYLDEAASAHLAEQSSRASELICRANMPKICGLDRISLGHKFALPKVSSRCGRTAQFSERGKSEGSNAGSCGEKKLT